MNISLGYRLEVCFFFGIGRKIEHEQIYIESSSSVSEIIIKKLFLYHSLLLVSVLRNLFLESTLQHFNGSLEDKFEFLLHSPLTHKLQLHFPEAGRISQGHTLFSSNVDFVLPSHKLQENCDFFVGPRVDILIKVTLVMKNSGQKKRQIRYCFVLFLFIPHSQWSACRIVWKLFTSVRMKSVITSF